MGKAWVMPETNERVMTRQQLEESIPIYERVLDEELERDRYDMKLIERTRGWLRQLDRELIRRDLGGC